MQEEGAAQVEAPKEPVAPSVEVFALVDMRIGVITDCWKVYVFLFSTLNQISFIVRKFLSLEKNVKSHLDCNSMFPSIK